MRRSVLLDVDGTTTRLRCVFTAAKKIVSCCRTLGPRLMQTKEKESYELRARVHLSHAPQLAVSRSRGR